MMYFIQSPSDPCSFMVRYSQRDAFCALFGCLAGVEKKVRLELSSRYNEIFIVKY